MALAACDKLVVPVNADDFSTAALRTMFFSVYGLFSFGGSLAHFEKGMFHNIIKDHSMPMPKIHAIIHNRSNIYGGEAARGFQAMNAKQASQLFSAFQEAMNIGQAESIFNCEQFSTTPTNAKEFAAAFTGTMRDMLTSAVATQHGGIPLWMINRYSKKIRADLEVASIKTSSTSSLADFIGVERSEGRGGREMSLMQLIQGTPIPKQDISAIYEEFNKNARESRGGGEGKKRARPE